MPSIVASIHVYHVSMLVGMIGGAVLFSWQLRRLEVSWRKILVSAPLAIALPVAGARIVDVLAYAFDDWERIRLLNVFAGGMSSHGAILGLIVATVILALFFRRPIGTIADRLVLWALIGVAVTRFADHELGQGMGTPTTWPWAITSSDGVMRHPTHIYEIGLVAALIMLALTHGRRLAKSRPGASAAVIMFLYFTVRLLLDGLREVASVSEGSPVVIGQVLSAPFILVFSALTFAWLRYPRPCPASWPADPEPPAEQIAGPLRIAAGLLVGVFAAGILGALAQQVVTKPEVIGGYSDSWSAAELYGYFALWALPLFIMAVTGLLVGRWLERWRARKARIIITIVLLVTALFWLAFFMLWAGSPASAGAWLFLAAVLPFRHRPRDLVAFIVSGAGALAVSQFVRPAFPDYFPGYISGPMTPVYFGLAGTLAAAAFELYLFKRDVSGSGARP